LLAKGDPCASSVGSCGSPGQSPRRSILPSLDMLPATRPVRISPHRPHTATTRSPTAPTVEVPSMNVHSCSMAHPVARSGRQPATLAEHTAVRSSGPRSSQPPATAPSAPLSSDEWRAGRPGTTLSGRLIGASAPNERADVRRRGDPNGSPAWSTRNRVDMPRWARAQSADRRHGGTPRWHAPAPSPRRE
jgi:hypothetical protein